ncbi:uncharacterized protein BKCO1_2100026 [Diplodia corticola]|uniref:Beta-lactamase superfamily domain-containing protein n=1 Tax=Diplodia corticola TaxID=236234 RepID=A0A1J9S405_9PEZI|nr:uncharacterized protein BKCO1_2100026 [Diplodia corticola]OJD34724.1 hypothetical protein BKCO1_2100026 [Diplodia corticola]
MLTVKALNADTSFLVTFSPSLAPRGLSASQLPGSFTILVDPWLQGPAQIISPKFSISQHKTKSCVSSLAELPEPDMVLISQDKPDHCHEETLKQLPPNSGAIILAAPAAAKKIRRWHHFPNGSVHALEPFSVTDDSRIFRLEIPSFSSSGLPGEVTVSLMCPKRDISGLHNAIGITYRAPTSALSPVRTAYIELPPTPPLSPTPSPALGRTSSMASLKISNPLPMPASYSPRPLTPSSVTPLDRERTLSLLYSPHGVPYSVIEPYASTHLIQQSALPLTALLHSFDRVDNPWYLGGNIATGALGGSDIARQLMAKCWVGAHDEEKDNRGLSVMKLKVRRMEVEELQHSLEESGISTKVARLRPGSDVKMRADEVLSIDTVS